MIEATYRKGEEDDAGDESTRTRRADGVDGASSMEDSNSR